MNNFDNILNDYLDAETIGKNWNPPITGDRVKKLLKRIDQKFWKKLGGKYYIWKDVEDPRLRNSDGSIHWGVLKNNLKG